MNTVAKSMKSRSCLLDNCHVVFSTDASFTKPQPATPGDIIAGLVIGLVGFFCFVAPACIVIYRRSFEKTNDAVPARSAQAEVEVAERA